VRERIREMGIHGQNSRKEIIKSLEKKGVHYEKTDVVFDNADWVVDDLL